MKKYNNQPLKGQSPVARPLVGAFLRPFRSRWNPIAPSKAKKNPSTIDRPAINIYCRTGSKQIKDKAVERLSTLSFRTGVIVLLSCIPFYILSFAQFALPIGAGAKGLLWVILFGLAKTTQYCGIAILGVKGLSRLRSIFQKTT